MHALHALVPHFGQILNFVVCTLAHGSISSGRNLGFTLHKVLKRRSGCEGSKSVSKIGALDVEGSGGTDIRLEVVEVFCMGADDAFTVSHEAGRRDIAAIRASKLICEEKAAGWSGLKYRHIYANHQPGSYHFLNGSARSVRSAVCMWLPPVSRQRGRAQSRITGFTTFDSPAWTNGTCAEAACRLLSWSVPFERRSSVSPYRNLPSRTKLLRELCASKLLDRYIGMQSDAGFRG